MIKLLLTSSGITNESIRDALMQLLGKPISEADALFIPTGVYPFAGGPNYAWWPIGGKMQHRLVGLGWKTIGLLELTALTSIDKAIWRQAIADADALLVWGGDPLYLAHWFAQSGLGELLINLEKDLVYVGVSAGSMAVCSLFGETYSKPRAGSGTPLTSETLTFDTDKGPVSTTLMTANGIGLTEFAIIPHYNNPDHPDACGANAAQWAAKIPAPVYAIGEQAAIRVEQGRIEVISEGDWKLF